MGKPGSIRAAFGAALKRSGVGSDLRFHDLRHEAVTRLFEKGLNPIEVGMISGHRSIEHAAALYAHASGRPAVTPELRVSN